MSESKSDALTNLATPLHRKRLAPRPSNRVSVGPAQQRMLRPGCGTSDRPSPAAAPPPAMSPGLGRPCRLSQTPRCPSPSSGCCRNGSRAIGDRRHLGACASAGGCRSLRPKPQSPKPGRALARKPASITARCRATSAGLPKMSRVAIAAAGLTTANHCGGSAIGVSRSPMPSTKALCPPTKKGTSAPSVSASASRRCARPVQAPQPVQRQQRAWRRRNCRRPCRRPRARCLSIEMSAPSGVPLAACSARAARRHRSSAGSAAPRSWRASRPSCAPLEVQRVAPVDQHEHRLQQVVAVGAPADHVQEQVQLGRRRHVEQRCAGSSQSSSRAAQPSPPAGRARAASDAGRSSKRARSTASRVARSPAPGCSGTAGRRAGPRPAAQPVEQRGQRQRLAEQASRDSASRSAKRRLALRRDQHAPRRATSAPAPASCPAAWSGRSSPLLGVAAQLEAALSAAPAGPAWPRRAPTGGRPAPADGARGAGGTAAQPARASAAQQPGAARPPDAHRSTCRRASVSRSTSLAASRLRASRQMRRASSRWPMAHSTSPRWAAISGSGRDGRPGAAGAAPRRDCRGGIRPSPGCR